MPACYTMVVTGAIAPLTVSEMVVLTHIIGLHATKQHKHIMHIDPAVAQESHICHMLKQADAALPSRDVGSQLRIFVTCRSCCKLLAVIGSSVETSAG